MLKSTTWGIYFLYLKIIIFLDFNLQVQGKNKFTVVVLKISKYKYKNTGNYCNFEYF